MVFYIYFTMTLCKILLKYSLDSSKEVFVTTLDSPVGKLIAAADDNSLYMASFADSKNFEKHIQTLAKQVPCRFVEKENKVLQKFEEELKSYFAGKLKKFTVSLKMIGSEFQKEVWQKLQELPYGTTRTYGDLAKAMGRAPSHSRAIGAACGANAILLVIPCHRLVASGSKGGFSCGVDRKEWLINHEKKFAT